MRASERMSRRWDERARRDAFHYVESATWDGDVEAFFRDGEARVAQVLDPLLPPRRELAVEIGSGVGRIARALASRFERVIGVDVSAEMVERARTLDADLAGVEFRAGDGLSLPVDADVADLVFSYVVFQHMPSREVIVANLREGARVLRADGRAVIQLPHGRRSLRRRLLSERVRAPLRRLLRTDPLKNDETWGGVGLLSEAEIRRLFDEAGLDVAAIHPDPTHEPGTRVIVEATPAARS